MRISRGVISLKRGLGCWAYFSLPANKNMNNYKQKCIRGAASSAENIKAKLRNIKWGEEGEMGRVVCLLGVLTGVKEGLFGVFEFGWLYSLLRWQKGGFIK
jgi:hypothetical protein